MSWLVWSACFDYLWLYSFFAPVPLPRFISLSVLSCLSHSAHILTFTAKISHRCSCVCVCVIVGVCMFFAWTFFIITVAPYCLFLSPLCAAAHPLAAARFKKSITPDQEAEVRAFGPAAQELTVGREWDVYAYCNPGDFAEHWTTTASHVRFTGLSRFFVQLQCMWCYMQWGAGKMCVRDFSPPSSF